MVRKGSKMSEEAKRKMSEAKKGRNNPFYGKPRSKATKRKISKAMKGQIPWNKGKKNVYSESQKKSMSLAQKKRFETKTKKRTIETFEF